MGGTLRHRRDIVVLSPYVICRIIHVGQLE